jgi:hypothetical protein
MSFYTYTCMYLCVPTGLWCVFIIVCVCVTYFIFSLRLDWLVAENVPFFLVYGRNKEAFGII